MTKKLVEHEPAKTMMSGKNFLAFSSRVQAHLSRSLATYCAHPTYRISANGLQPGVQDGEIMMHMGCRLKRVVIIGDSC